MIKPLVNKKAHTGLILAIFLGWEDIAYSAEIHNFSNTHPYSSYADFTYSVCLPCHYKNIPNGTDLHKLLPDPPEAKLKNFLLPILRDGHMPPNVLYRKILYDKFLQIK